MANTPLDNLAAALKRDAGNGPLLLNRTWLLAALGVPVQVSERLDSDLKAAFQSADAGLALRFSAQDVQPVDPANGTLRVTGVSARFLQKDVDKAVQLTFTVKDPTQPSLALQIDTTPASWNWSDLSPLATGQPFDWARISGASFSFHDSLGPCQRLTANLVPPAQLSNALSVVSNLLAPTIAVPLSGLLDFSQVDQVNILLPTATLEAPLLNAGSDLRLFYLKVGTPVFGLSIHPAEKQDADDPDEAFFDQQIDLYFGVRLGVQDQDGKAVNYQLQALAEAGGGYGFAFNLGHCNDGSALLTPATVIGLMNDEGSFFSGTPAVLQQFLAGVGLRNINLIGSRRPGLRLSSIGVTLGADPTMINAQHPWAPFQDPTNQLVFGITDFELAWGLDFLPDGSKAQSYQFQTSFILLPQVFKGHTPGQDGLFFVQFNADLQLLARFDGVASLNDLIRTVSVGLIDIAPSLIDASLSDIQLEVDVNAKRYAFNGGFDLALNLFTFQGKPILSISDGQFYLRALTPTGSSRTGTTPTTCYQAGIGGLVGIGPWYANAQVDYDGTQTPARWEVAAHLAQPVSVQELVSQFLSPFGSFQCPPFLPGNLQVRSLDVEASLGGQQRYSVAGTLQWAFNLGQAFSVNTLATLEFAFDASKPEGQQYSGSASTLWDFSFLNDSVLLAYSFAPDNQGSNALLTLSWEGLTATYALDSKDLTFTLKNWSLGRLIQKLVQSLGDPYFTLPSPWDVLNKISLDGLSLIINLGNADGKASISAKYTLPSKIDLGFISIEGLVFERKPVNGVDKITLAIDGKSAFTSGDPQQQQDWKNLLNPSKGQPVDKLPSVPGQGNEYFDLPLLVLGQRVAISGYSDFPNTQSVINALKQVPATADANKPNPLNPSDGGKKGQPYYNRASDWLIAGQLLLLKAGNDWTIDLMLVFNDPNLYGLRLALAGEKAKALGNLELDILYKKITDDVGVYQIEWTFPDSIRNLNFGAVSIVLPEIGVKIYTNGDFYVDVGFPYNLDFTRSFSLSAIVYGVPVLGAGGFYLGKLSSVTATQVPKTRQGTFDPVIVFGLGLQLGLGYNFVKGPLKAGFALTVFGILEGTIAAFHPYQPGKALVAKGSSVQTDYYFKIQGTVGVIGLLYGSIDFAIISAAVNVRITLSLSLTYESYKPIPIAARATVEVSVKVKIDLGLFSFSISFSFHADVSARFEINALESGTPPWADPATLLQHQARYLQLAAQRRARQPRAMAVVRSAAKPRLDLYVTPQFTVLANEGERDPANQQGAFVLLLCMDAPSPTGNSADAGQTSFARLCADYLPWLLGTLGSAQSAADTLDDVRATLASKAMLEVDIARLADLANPPFGIAELLGLLSSFEVDITLPDASNQAQIKARLEQGSTLFPVFDGLTLQAPGAQGAPQDIAFASYTTCNSTYRANVAQLFSELAAIVATHDDAPASRLRAAAALDDRESMAAVIFTDAFMVIGRQLLQAALNAFEDFAYPTAAGNSIAGIQQWANDSRGNLLTLDNIVTPNLDMPLSTGLPLLIPLQPYTLQTADTLARIAAAWSDASGASRWQTTPEQLILANAQARVVAANLLIGSYTTGPGESFASLAEGLGISLAQLAQDSTLYGLASLLLPGQPLQLPVLRYVTCEGDTLSGAGARFGVSAMALFDTPQAAANLAAAPLFAAPQVTLSGLHSLFTDDLWSVIAATDQLSQLAGMLSRFLAYGLRLPANPAGAGGLELGPQFIYPRQQQGYGLYQLTGQQFPAPGQAAPGATLPVTLGRDSSSHSVDLSFISIAGGSSGSMDLAPANDNLALVLAYARQGKFQPAPQVAVLPSVARTAKEYAVKGVSLWASADLAQLQALCQPGQTLADGPGSKAQPLLWSLPDGLVQLLNQRVGRLATRLPNLRARLPYLPAFEPCQVLTNPATLDTRHETVATYCYATRIDFTLKRLPQNEPGAVASLGSNLAYTYQLLGPSAVEAQLLERLLGAMDELGDAFVSGQFLLMPQGDAKARNLLSQADSDFLAFITQTNLSTETNPPPQLAAALATQDVAMPRGILNPVAETVKLLWELSTVRSGGYYLSYYDLQAGAGLPDAVFDDSGTATLTLVVSYQRQGPLGERPGNFVNAFVTTDSVQQQGSHMSLRSMPTASASLPTQASDSLQSLADFYGIGVGRIAELNPTARLRTGAQVPVVGIIHLVTPADAAAGNGQSATILDNLAAYYSVGAVTPLSGADIARINPGVSAANGIALFIPTLTYAVSSAPAPGASLQALADYYGLSLDSIAVTAAPVQGLLDTEQTLQIDTSTFDLQAVHGQGNVAFSVERDNPPAVDGPTPDPDAYAQAYLYNLYSVLSAGLDSSPWFTGNDLALPFGPQRPDATAEQARAHRLAMRDPAQRRVALAALADSSHYHYQQTLGLARQARTNAALPPQDPALPAVADNPYRGVGSFAQLDLAWHDLFGNITVTPFEQPPSGYAGSLNHPPLALRYTDRLIGLSAWPNTRAVYTYQGQATQVSLALLLSLDLQAYAGSDEQARERAGKDLALYRQVWFQLDQSYAGLDLPWCDSRAVTVELRNSLLAQPLTQLDEQQSQPLRDYIEAVIRYLAQRASGSAGAPAPAATLTLPVDTQALAQGAILPLSLTLTLRRCPALVEPDVAGLEGGVAVTSTLLPCPDAVGTSISGYSQFARDFEALFQQPGSWLTRVGSGTADPGATPDGRSQTLWACRFALQDGAPGIRYQLDEAPGYFAARPISHTLTSASVRLYPDYHPDQPFPSGEMAVLNLTGVDQNTWFETALKAVDSFLSPTYTPPVFLLDTLLGHTDPLSEGWLARVLKAKQRLADDIASTLEPILDTGPQAGPTRAAAAEKLRQALLNQLYSAYSTTAIVGFAMTGRADGAPVALYGQPTVPGAGPTAPGNDNYAFGSARAPLASTDSDSAMAFAFNSRNEKAQSYVPLHLDWQVSHLEHDARSVGVEGYVQSNWISLISGPLQLPLAAGRVMNLPVLLRALPQPPTIQLQSASRWCDQPQAPADLSKWTYAFETLYQSSAQDNLNLSIALNTPQGALRSAGDTDALVSALAQFVTVYPQVEVAMQQTLVALDAAKPVQQQIDQANHAVGAFVYLVEQLAEAYHNWASPDLLNALAYVAPQALTCTFSQVLTEVSVDGQDGVAQVQLLAISINEQPAQFDPATGRISATVDHYGLVSLPAPVVDIDPHHYQAVRVSDPTAAGMITYRYLLIDSQPATWLTADAARENPQRVVSLPGLSVFDHQDAWASLWVERNRILFPLDEAASTSTNPAFRFSTPVVRFADSISPQISQGDFALAPAATLASCLEQFFAALGEGSNGTTVQLALEARYSYALAATPGLHRTVLPATLMLPVATSVDSVPAFVAPFSQAMDAWRLSEQVTTQGSPHIDLTLHAFSADDPIQLKLGAQPRSNQPPLLSIETLWVDATQVPPQQEDERH